LAEEIPNLLKASSPKLWSEAYSQVGIATCDHKFLGSMTVLSYASSFVPIQDSSQSSENEEDISAHTNNEDNEDLYAL
jgi:hypothetical protein